MILVLILSDKTNMTLTICIKAKDGIVLASDSRASSFLTSNDTVKKLFGLDSHTAIGIAGDGSLAMHLIDTISSQLNYRNGITNLAEQLRSLGKKQFDEFFSHLIPEKRPELTILLAGYNVDKPEIYRLESTDNFVPRKNPTGFDCVGIPIIANYLLNRVYEHEVSVEHATEMAAFCIKETGSQDRRVGGPIQIATFSDTKAYAELSKEEIDKISDRCEKYSLLHKGNFYPESVSGGTSTPEDAKRT